MSAQPQFFNDVSRRYTTLLSELPSKVVKDLKVFLQWMKTHPCPWSLLREPALSLQWAQVFLAHFYEAHGCHPLTKLFLKVLMHHRRLALLPEILACFSEQTQGKKVIYFRVAKRLSPQALSSLTHTLSRYWNEPIVLRQEEDSSLLLGGILLWDHFMLDLSLKTVLDHLQKETLHGLSHA